MTPAELAEKLESFASEQDEKADVETNRAMRVGFGNEAKLLRQAAALISAQAAEIARLEEAAGEVWDEAYNEGACDTAGWEKETAHAVLQWLDKEGDGFDINHPDGNTTDAIIQGLYDAKRSGNLAELRQAAALVRSMEGALRKAVGMLEHVSVTMDWDEEEAAQSQAIWDADVASIRAALSGEKQ